MRTQSGVKMFSNYNLVSAAKEQDPTPTQKRRDRLVMQIDKQISLVKHHQPGDKPRGRWWTLAFGNGPFLTIKYGRVPLELSKGKFAIACSDFEEMTSALNEARAGALAGEFDAQLEAIATKIRTTFNHTRAQ